MDNMKEGTNEFAVHICTNSSSFKQEFPWYKNGTEELEALMGVDIKGMMEEKDIKLISHREV